MSGDSVCRSCGAPIRWFKTTKQKNIPCDLPPRKMATVMKDGETVWIGDAYTVHWETCPNADQHRQPREPQPQAPSAPPAGGPPDDDIPF
jgi:hypothetical protein